MTIDNVSSSCGCWDFFFFGIFLLMWLFFSSGGCWDFWDFWEQLLHLDSQLVSDEEHLQPVVGKSISFIFVFKNIFNNNNQLCSLNSNLAKGSYGHKVIWVMIATLFTLALNHIKAFIRHLTFALNSIPSQYTVYSHMEP